LFTQGGEVRRIAPNLLTTAQACGASVGAWMTHVLYQPMAAGGCLGGCLGLGFASAGDLTPLRVLNSNPAVGGSYPTGGFSHFDQV
jgi:hypothetical protein